MAGGAAKTVLVVFLPRPMEGIYISLDIFTELPVPSQAAGVVFIYHFEHYGVRFGP